MASSLASLVPIGGPSLPGFGQKNEEFDGCFTLTRTQRLYGFAGCFCFGVLLSILGVIMLFSSVTKFAILYTLGNIVGLCSTGFLIGPVRQLRNMFEKKRILATCAFLGTMILTIVLACTMHGAGRTVLCLICLVIQFCALVWYTASYFPYGREMLQKFVCTMCSRATS